MKTKRLGIGIYRWSRVILIVGSLLVGSCSMVTRESANEIFLKENPTFQIVDSGPGEGWSDVVYWHFRYKTADDPTVREMVYCFEYRKDQWIITQRYEPKE